VDIKLQKQIELIDKYLTYLGQQEGVTQEEFIGDIKLQASVERWLQLSIECCINIGAILISMEKLHRGENFADIFVELNKANLLSDNLTKRLINMVKFRNRLVHVYWNIDPETIYSILKNNLGDIKEFIEEVLKIIQNKHAPAFGPNQKEE